MTQQLNNPADQKKILNAMREVSNSMVRIAAERDLIKDIVNDVSEKFQLDKKIFKKMCNTFHKDNYSENVAEAEEFVSLYEKIVKETSAPHGESDED
jgi:hypothetical protein